MVTDTGGGTGVLDDPKLEPLRPKVHEPRPGQPPLDAVAELLNLPDHRHGRGVVGRAPRTLHPGLVAIGPAQGVRRRAGSSVGVGAGRTKPARRHVGPDPLHMAENVAIYGIVDHNKAGAVPAVELGTGGIDPHIGQHEGRGAAGLDTAEAPGAGDNAADAVAQERR